MVQHIKYFEISPTQAWLIAQNGEKRTRFAWPPFKGTHQKCYRAIAEYKGLTPAEGLDLALLINGAYTQHTSQWKSVNRNFNSNYVRTPHRCLLIPRGNINGDPSLSGILVERDVEGKGSNTRMKVPDLSSWRQNDDGVYVQHDNSYSAVFVPSTSYEGRSFEKDGVAHAHLTPEGAELFARTARDAGLVPHNWLAHKVKKIKSPEQRVSLLSGKGDRLGLDGNADYNRNGRAFAVLRKTAEGSAPYSAF